MHIRRTDKLRDAKNSFHNVNEYFDAAEAYFNTTGYTNDSLRNVFLASDEHLVLEEAKNR